MKKFIIILLYLLSVLTNIKAQINLIPNGDFEIYDTLPTSSGQWYHAIGWNNLYSISNPDYFNTLSYTGGLIAPFSGNGDIGLFIWTSTHPNYREYISAHLNSSMIQGKHYRVSFYLSNSTNTSWGTLGSNNFGVCFSFNPLQQTNFSPIPINPQFEISNIVYFNNFWHHFSFNYKADSLYNYITFGNFKNDANTLISSSGLYHSYYVIDNTRIYPIFQITGNTSICKGNTDVLKNDQDSVLIWKDTANISTIIAIDSMITVSPNVTTTYMAYNNYDTAYFTVNVYNPPIVNIGNDTTLCQGQSLLLDASTPSAFYTWQDYSQNPTYTVTQAGTYWVKVMAGYCTVRDTIHVAYNATPIVNIGNDTTLCYGQTLTLNAALPNATYLWQDGSSNSTFTVSPPYIPYVFYVKATVNNCVGYDTLTISYIPAPTKNFGRDTVLCNGDSIVLDVTNPNATYVWHDNTTNPTYNANQSGIYSVIITMDGCIFKDTINVVISPPLTINLGSDTSVCIGSLVILDPRNLNTTYQWQDGSSGSTYTVSQQGVYWVKVTDINKCIATDTILISINDCDTSKIIIPNIFTPNGDGYNDYFVINQTDYKTIEVQIYNRWGIKVFEDNNYQNNWDGKYKGNPLADGTYYYIIKSKGIYNKKDYYYNGSLTIMR